MRGKDEPEVARQAAAQGVDFFFWLVDSNCGSLGLEWDFNGFQYEFNRISIEFQWDCCSSSVTLLCAAWFTGPGPPKTEVPAAPAVPAVPAVPSVVAAVPAVAPAVVSVAPMVAQVPPQTPVSSLRF